MFQEYKKNKIKICIVGGGYIGLPLATSFAKKNFNVTLFDINKKRIKTLRKGIDSNNETLKKDLVFFKKINFTNNSRKLLEPNIFIITAPTPVNKNNVPDLRYIKEASKTVGSYLKNNNIVIFESTVYPGLTEEVCLPILEQNSKLVCYNLNNNAKNNRFHLGYSPERINPGDKKHTLKKISKIVSSNNIKLTRFLKKLYEEIIDAKIVMAQNIKIAEAAKVIENSQRDINIAFINELSIIFNKLNINTRDVLNLASTKWNFINFKPGLVGGHCIGVDPYYLTYCSKKIKYNPEVILSGRKINNYMPKFIVKNFLKLAKKKNLSNKKVMLFGATFKENCNDIRNSKSIEVAELLKKKNFEVDFFDPYVSGKYVNKFRNLKKIKKNYYSAFFFNVSHDKFLKIDIDKLRKKMKKNAVIFDIKNIFPSSKSDFCL